MSRSQYSQWYADRKWRAKRARQLQAEPLCRYCQQIGRLTPATIVDHIDPHRGDRNAFWQGAVQSLCGPCHSSVKQREEGKGGPTACGADGQPLGHHHWNREGG